MTSQCIVTLLCYLALLMISLDNTILVNAAPVVANCNDPSLELSECASVVADPTEDNPLYSHSELFGAAATPKDVEAFKYYCINDLMVSIISEQIVSQYMYYQEFMHTTMWYSHVIYGLAICLLQESITLHPLDNIPLQSDSSDMQLDSLKYILQENITITCQYYSTLKAYQYMLYQFLHSQDTNVSNATTTSVMYLLQTAAESLQIIQVSLLI